MGAVAMMLAGGGSRYLDHLTVQPRAVLSLRKLISTATVAIRVRRSSDNAEQDIGFTGNALDTASLASFVGANSAYVTKFYDQTANAQHAEQATSASQPRIVNAGTYQGVVTWDNTDDFLKITSLTMGTDYVGLYFKAKSPANHGDGTGDILFELSTDYTAISGSFAVYANTAADSYGCAMRTSPNNSAEDHPLALSSIGQATVLFDRSATGAAEIRAWKSGSETTPVSSSISEMSGSFVANDLYLGSRGGASRFGRLELETLVIYRFDTSSIRANIEALVA